MYETPTMSSVDSSPTPHPADRRILSYLDENPPDYLPVVATRLGMHLRYVERRVDTLIDHGLVQAVTAEVIYTTTEKGSRYLVDGDRSFAADRDA